MTTTPPQTGLRPIREPLSRVMEEIARKAIERAQKPPQEAA